MADTDNRVLEAFEAFMKTEAPSDYDASNGDAWYVWKACWAAALASRPAEVDDEGLPPPPKATAWMVSVSGVYEYYATRRAAERDRQIYEHSVADDPDMEREEPEPLFTAEQYRQGQRDAVAADRARRK